MTAKRRSIMRNLVIGLSVLAIAWVIGCGVIYSEMRKPPEVFGRFMTKIPAPVAFLAFPFETLWTHARSGELEPGDAAPDFKLLTVDKQEWVQLSELTHKQPVVLVFGSYT